MSDRSTPKSDRSILRSPISGVIGFRFAAKKYSFYRSSLWKGVIFRRVRTPKPSFYGSSLWQDVIFRQVRTKNPSFEIRGSNHTARYSIATPLCVAVYIAPARIHAFNPHRETSLKVKTNPLIMNAQPVYYNYTLQAVCCQCGVRTMKSAQWPHHRCQGCGHDWCKSCDISMGSNFV